MKIRWAARAEDDLTNQCAHIARDDPALAVRIGEDIFAAVERLADFPYRGRSGRVPDTRELVLPGLPWIAVYAVEGHAITVLRLLHGAQLWPPDDQQ